MAAALRAEEAAPFLAAAAKALLAAADAESQVSKPLGLPTRAACCLRACMTKGALIISMQCLGRDDALHALIWSTVNRPHPVLLQAGAVGSRAVRVSAFRALRHLLEAVHDADALAFIVPGVAGGLSKALIDAGELSLLQVELQGISLQKHQSFLTAMSLSGRPVQHRLCAVQHGRIRRN